MTQRIAAFTQAPHVVKGSLFAIVAFFFMALFGILTKVACETGDAIWVSFITYSIATMGTALLILPRGIAALKSKHYSYLIARAVIGTTASFLYMISMHYIPIINSTLLFNTAPLFIPLLTVCVLKIPIKKNIWCAVLIGFIGILVIIKPGDNIFTDPGNLIGLLSGFALAVAYLFMKLLTSTDTGLRIVFFYFSIGTLMQVPLLWLTDNPPSTLTFCYASLSGVMLMAAQLGLVRAYKYADASQVGVYQYSSVVFVAMMEWLIWSRAPGLLDYIGFVLVSVAGIFIIFSSRNKVKNKDVY
ncbi:MAG: DMT family transporter [Gammaproteobacteria bacterium]|nr:DMT family transporter [Gammaproteobacteria bacterium]